MGIDLFLYLDLRMTSLLFKVDNSFQDMKAAGIDGLKPIVLKHLGDSAVTYLTQLLKASILLRYVPKCWRESTVIYIPKPGKDNYSDPKAYRPISLLTCILKVLEKLILIHLIRI